MSLGETLLTTDRVYAESAWQCPLADTAEQRALLRQAPGLVLHQEGLTRDFISAGNRQVRRNVGLAISDRIVLRLLVSPEVWWALHYNLDLVQQELLVEELEINLVDVETARAQGWEEVFLGDKKGANFTIWATCAKTDSVRLGVLAHLS